VYGLATTPNGELQVADASSGVLAFANGKATLLAAFPGASDVAPIGMGSWWVVRGSADGAQFTDNGQGVYRISRGKVRKLANLFEFEVANDPVAPGANGLPESNPFDIEALDGETALVADAAGNDLLRVTDEGEVSVVATFPYEMVPTANFKALLGCPGSGAPACAAGDLMPAQPVPTSITVGPDGYYYVGELKGIPAPVNESRVWRIAPDASWAACPDADCELLYDGGFTSIIDLAFGPDGLLYVLEMDEASWFAGNVNPPALQGGTINACDAGGGGCAVVASGLVLPTALTFGKDGTLYSTLFALIPGMATVVEIP
jgi:hypothetical protein